MSADSLCWCGHAVEVDHRAMTQSRSIAVAACAAIALSSVAVLPGRAEHHHHHDHHHHDHHNHFVCALGYHYAGHGRCVRNGPWWEGNRPVNWGPYYEPRRKAGSVTFEGPKGGEIKLKW